MKVLHVIPSVSLAHGGPSIAISSITRSLAERDIPVVVATTDDDGPGRRLKLPSAHSVMADGATRLYFPKQTEFYLISWPFWHWIANSVARFDVVHVHALFSFTSICAARAARRQGVPYVIRPLGVLNNWGMRNRRPLLKSLSLAFLERPILRHAAAMHYTSRRESIEAKAAGATSRPCIIPIGLDLAPFQRLPDARSFFERWPQTRGRKIVLFLGRIHRIKGLDKLLAAFLEVRRKLPESCLVVAGEGSSESVQEYRQLAVSLGLADAMVWTGFMAAEDKLAALAAATVFVLPSYSENFGIALVEAMAAGRACVTTTGVALSEELRSREAAIVVPAEAPAIAAGLIRLLEDESLRRELGERARRLALEKFSLAAMGDALNLLYQEVTQN